MNLTATLKQETRAYHNRMEANAFMSHLMSDTLSHDEYVLLLSKFLGFYAPIEQRLLQLPEWEYSGIDIKHRLKTPLLAHDLHTLGLSDDEMTNLPRCADLPLLDSFPRALGCFYVLEGSTLGGQLISRHLHHRLGLVYGKGATFFGSYGSAVGPMWKNFCANLNTYAQKNHLEPYIPAMVEAAGETFDAMDRWLSQ